MKTIKKTNKKTAAATTAAIAAPPSATIIEAKIDVGFGNMLFVRGQGAGLSWNKGVPLICLDRQTWKLSLSANEKLTFKLLLNDATWSQGEDWMAEPGQKLTVMPKF